MAKRAFNAPASDLFKFDPEELQIPTTGALADSRTDLPVLEELVLSIMASGVIEPIVIGKADDGSPFVIDGRQRVKAAREAAKRLKAQGSKIPLRVPCAYRKTDDVGAYLAMIGANEHRQEDNALEKAKKLQRALDLGATEEEAMIACGITTRATTKAWLRLLDAGPELRKAIKGGVISPTAASKIADLPNADQKAKLAELTAGGHKPTVARAAKVRKNKPADGPKMRTRKNVQNAVDTSSLILKTMNGLEALLWVLGDEDGRLD